MIKRDWTSFKSYIQSKGVYPQYFGSTEKYELFYATDGLIFTCTIFKDGDVDQIDFETNFKSKSNANNSILNNPFAAKTLPNSKKLYKREHGIQQALTAGSNIFVFTIPYTWVKILGIEVVNGEALDYCDLNILDSVTGTYTTIPNYKLNQFGFSVNICKDYYEEENSYDADLYQGMQIQIIYQSVSAKTIGINFNLSEVK